MVKYVGHTAVIEASDISDRDTLGKKELNQVSETDLKTFSVVNSSGSKAHSQLTLVTVS